MLAAPVQFRGRVLGVIVVVKAGLDQYSSEHLRLLTVMADQLAPNLAYARLLGQRYLAA